MTANAQLGQWGESLARRQLESAGYRIAANNYRCREGEIDLVAIDNNGETVFIEVKTRRGTTFGPPEESISPTRATRLAQAAEHYLQSQTNGQYPSATEWRIDLLCINLDRRGKLLSINHIKHAVEL